MSKATRGRAVIINNKYFLRQDKRMGCELDETALQKLFKGLHFDVVVHRNMGAKVTSFC
jgi:Caspase domain